MRSLILFFTILYSTYTFAIFCPTNFSSINYGASIAEVIKLCGAPGSQKQYSKSNGPIPPAEWDYFINAPVLNSHDSPTEKLAFIFKDGQVININFAGQNLANTNLCGNVFLGSRLVRLGDSMETVKAACGQPAFINQSQSVNTQPANSIQITELFYNVSPPITLIFENGILTDRV